MSAKEILRRVVAALDTAGIPYMITGSFAAGYWGVQRSTFDIDIVIDPSRQALDAFVASLDPSQVYVDLDTARDALRRRSQFNLIDIETNWKVDLVIRKSRPFSEEEMARRARGTILEIDVRVATVEDSIISKLEWAKAGESDRQLRDVREMLSVHNKTLDRAYIERWVRELELEELWQRVQP